MILNRDDYAACATLLERMASIQERLDQLAPALEEHRGLVSQIGTIREELVKLVRRANITYRECDLPIAELLRNVGSELAAHYRVAFKQPAEPPSEAPFRGRVATWSSK